MSNRIWHRLVCFGHRGSDGRWAEKWFMDREALAYVCPRALLWQSRLENKTRIPHVPDAQQKQVKPVAVLTVPSIRRAVLWLSLAYDGRTFLTLPQIFEHPTKGRRWCDIFSALLKDISSILKRYRYLFSSLTFSGCEEQHGKNPHTIWSLDLLS